jgi:hypothetical protein
MAEILLKVVLNIVTLTLKSFFCYASEIDDCFMVKVNIF